MMKVAFYSFLIILFSVLFCFASVHPFVSAGIGQKNESAELYQSSIYSAAAGIESGHAGLSFSMGYLSQSNKTQTLQPGTVTLIPLMGNVYLKIPITARFSFSFGMGAGWVAGGYDLDPTIVRDLDLKGAKIHAVMKEGFGSQAFGGFEYRLAKNWSVDLGAKYLFFDTSVTTDTTWQTKYFQENFTQNQISFDGPSVIASLKYTWR